MEKITCKGCQATIDYTLEFCSSCGEWLGLKLDEVIDEVAIENTSEAKKQRIEKLMELPVKPLRVVMAQLVFQIEKKYQG